jgi:sulfotransferase family protein
MSAAPKNIVWIASYPKSGNTWVRFLACNLLHGDPESAAALNTLAPDIHESVASTDAPAPAGLLKTHFQFSENLPYAARSAAAIYVVWDPADVLASNFFYSQRSAARTDASAAVFNDYVDAFIENRGDPRWIERGMGSWEENVRSWLNPELTFPVLMIRYEDLTADPIQACRTIAQRLRLTSTETQIRRAVQNSTFERMREVERADIREKRVGIFYKPYLQASIDSGSRFMRRGIVGDGSARLSAEQRVRLRGAFAPLLRELGYSNS